MIDVDGRHYEAAEDVRRMRRLELFPLINRLRDRMKRGADVADQLIPLEREYADLMAASTRAGFR